MGHQWKDKISVPYGKDLELGQWEVYIVQFP